MARQLPAIVPDKRPLARAADTPSTVARVVAAIAPDVIRLAERTASERLARSRQAKDSGQAPHYTEAIHLSEVEIHVAMPFIRSIIMRNLTAWQNGPAEVLVAEPERRASGKLRKAGLLGASGMIALAAGVMMRRVGPFASGRQTVIDVPGRPKP